MEHIEATKLPGGLWPVMLTPFLENNQLDSDGLKELTSFYLNAGAQGLFSNCLSSEMFQLTNEERLCIIRTVVAAAGSRVPVVASGTFSSNLKAAADFIKQVHDTGVDAVILVTNQIVDMDEDDEAFKRKIEVLLSLTGQIPLGIYECPNPYKRLISSPLMQWLGQTGRFFYHKDTSCEMEAIKSKIDAVRGTSLSIYNAHTPTAIDSLACGAAGISPICANFYPELYTFMVREFMKHGKTTALLQLNAQLDMMDAVADQYYPYSAKLFLQQRGLFITPACRIPIPKMKREDHQRLQDLMDVFNHTAAYYNVHVMSLKN